MPPALERDRNEIAGRQQQPATRGAVVNALAKAGIERWRDWKHLSTAEGEGSLAP